MKTERNNKIVTIYTDGACSGNPGPGGWGAVLLYAGHTKKIYGGEQQTTNNRMELLAAIKALQQLKTNSHVVLYTDSKYVKEGITSWLANWKRNHWQTAAKKPVKNKDLWQMLDGLAQQHCMEWRWVKGHAGIAGNEEADRLALQGIKEAV